MSSRWAKSSDAFPVRHEMIDGHRRRVRIVTCDKCHYPARLLENTTTSFPPEVIAKKFMQRGWSLNGMNVCPRCQAGKKPMAPAARRAAYCAIRARELEDTNMEPAEAPRLPTAADRRRIRDFLDTHYDEDAGRYRQSFSDKALAAKLDVPSRWVSDLRDGGGYGPDVNEAGAMRSVEIEALALELATLQADLISRFDSLEQRLKRLTGGLSDA